ncbi:hypothetical protein MUG91_G133n4 [Manis pentadactyla]|nr:hypothetical protein MUG91_G133n4 [Manis pentadactyla]
MRSRCDASTLRWSPVSESMFCVCVVLGAPAGPGEALPLRGARGSGARGGRQACRPNGPPSPDEGNSQRVSQAGVGPGRQDGLSRGRRDARTSPAAGSRGAAPASEAPPCGSGCFPGGPWRSGVAAGGSRSGDGAVREAAPLPRLATAALPRIKWQK